MFESILREFTRTFPGCFQGQYLVRPLIVPTACAVTRKVLSNQPMLTELVQIILWEAIGIFSNTKFDPASIFRATFLAAPSAFDRVHIKLLSKLLGRPLRVFPIQIRPLWTSAEQKMYILSILTRVWDDKIWKVLHIM